VHPVFSVSECSVGAIFESIVGNRPLTLATLLNYFVSKGHAVLGAGFGYLDRGGFAGSFGGLA
jgi:hypothetical protein